MVLKANNGYQADNFEQFDVFVMNVSNAQTEC